MDKKFIDLTFEIKGSDIEEDGTFKGYGSTFNGKPDSYGDIILPGAFAKSLAKGGRNRSGIAMLWSHKADEPVGVWISIIEDKRGLRVIGQLILSTPGGKKAYELLKAGAIKGLSIGYVVVDFEDDKQKRVRYLKEVDLWEISLVVFPANVRATVTEVKEVESGGNILESVKTLTKEIETLENEAIENLTSSSSKILTARNSNEERAMESFYQLADIANFQFSKMKEKANSKLDAMGSVGDRLDFVEKRVTPKRTNVQPNSDMIPEKKILQTNYEKFGIDVSRPDPYANFNLPKIIQGDSRQSGGRSITIGYPGGAS